MIKTENRIRWEGLDSNNPETWLPVLGGWCGPGWTAGKRTTATSTETSEKDGKIHLEDEKLGPVDKLCRIHDHAYGEAQGQPDEKEQKSRADIKLLEALASLLTQYQFTDKLTHSEYVYIQLMRAAFSIKTAYNGSKTIVKSVKVLQEHLKAQEIRQPTTIKDQKQSTFAGQQASAKDFEYAKAFLGNILTPDILFNPELLAQHQFASTQQKEFVKDAVNDVLHSKFPAYGDADMDFLFKQSPSKQSAADTSTSSSESEPPDPDDEYRFSRARNYV